MKKGISMIIMGSIMFTLAFTYYTSSNYYNYKPYTQKKTYNYKNGGQIYLQKGYTKSNGTYVQPHLKTKPDNYTWNNLGTWK